jgi:DNA replication licensing factor MCM6
MSLCGTVTRTSEVRPELLYASFICRKCGTLHNNIEQQFQFTEPTVCKNQQCHSIGSFELLLSQCVFTDWQRLRVQENAEEIPPGSMPRSLDLICRNELVEIAKAGDKAVFTGSVTVIPDFSGVARMGETTTLTNQAKSAQSREMGLADGITGLKRLGVKEMSYKMIFIVSHIHLLDQRDINHHHSTRNNKNINKAQLYHNVLPYYHEMMTAMLHTEDNHNNNNNSDDIDTLFHTTTTNNNNNNNTANNTINNTHNIENIELPPTFTDNDYTLIQTMYNTPQLYTHMAQSLCPTVCGHIDIKRGLLLMLLGGVHKLTRVESIPLRGDINVCIVGDPACGKSQFLKYIHSFLSRSVYTSGKSSSAAGLTASVIRDHETGEFCVEAGALMLADNGICCIDEFDKVSDYYYYY